MGAPKGHKKYGGGRAKGTPNKTTAGVKAALLLVYDKIGGDEKFAEWAGENLTEFYKLYAKMLPTEIKNAGGETFRMQLVEEIVGAGNSDPQNDSAPPGSV